MANKHTMTLTFVPNLPGEANRLLVHENRGDMRSKEYMPAIKNKHKMESKQCFPMQKVTQSSQPQRPSQVAVPHHDSMEQTRQLSRRIVTTPLRHQTTKSRPRVAGSRHAILFAHHANGWAHRSGLVTLLSLRNTSQDSPTRHCSVVETIACLSAITSPHLLYRIFYTKSSLPNPTLQGERVLLQLRLTPTLQTARLIGIMPRPNNQSA